MDAVKRRHADRFEWTRVSKRRFALTHVESDAFTGYAALLELTEVEAPLMVECCGESLCIADAGHLWLQHFPQGEHHVVTTMFDETGRVVQWYIDICKGQGVDQRGVPYLDDLYLDVVVLPGGRVELLDEDELDDALRSGDITPFDHSLAHAEARRVQAAIREGRFAILDLADAHRALLTDLLQPFGSELAWKGISR